MGGAKATLFAFLKPTQPRTSKPKHVKNVHGGGIKPRKLKMKKQSEGEIIKNNGNLFRLTNTN